MRHVNPNTSALNFALQCDLPTLKEEALRLVLEAATRPTLRERAQALGVNERAFYRLHTLAQSADKG